MADDLIQCEQCQKPNKVGRKKCMFCGGNLIESGKAEKSMESGQSTIAKPKSLDETSPTSEEKSPPQTPPLEKGDQSSEEEKDGDGKPLPEKSRDQFLKIKMAGEEEKEEDEEEEEEDIDWGTYVEDNFPGFPVDFDSLQKIAPVFEKSEVMDAKEFLDFADAAIKSGKTVCEILLEYDKVKPEKLAEVEAEFFETSFLNLSLSAIDKKIGLMLKEDFCKLNFCIPVQIAGNDLLVAMIDPSSTDIIAEISTLTGFSIRPTKCLKIPLMEQIALIYPKSKVEDKSAKKGNERPKRLGDFLKDLGFVKEEELNKAFDYGKEKKVRLGEALVRLEICNNKQISIALSKQYGLPYIDLDESLVDPIVADILPKKLCYDYTVCPVKFSAKTITLAMEDPTDIITLDHVRQLTGAKIDILIANNVSIKSALDKLFGDPDDLMSAWSEEGQSEEDAALSGFEEDSAPIIKLVNMCINEAVKLKVSDIHIESFEHETLIRFRREGTMSLYMKPPKAAYPAIISRLKIMANLNIAENRLPQDGRIQMRVKKKKIDLRVSILPCVWGEKVVMRILDQENLKVNLKELGFEPKVYRWFAEGLKSPNGVVLVTGPTGSGKTTTLYSALTAINKPGENIMTAEDPAEFNLVGINQVNCNAAIGLTFAAALRSFLRQDPDIIMVGEIRDYETASISFKAAMTGHLVLSTLHTNDAPGTISRLLQMGIEPFMVATATRVVQAQRLVKTVCLRCKELYKPNDEELSKMGVNPSFLEKAELSEELTMDTVTFTRAKGCEACNNKGYAGRMGIYEVMRMNDKMRNAILSKASPELIRMTALADGMLSLRESATFKMVTGLTSIEQIIATTKEEKQVILDEEGNPIFKRRYTRAQLVDFGIDADEFKKMEREGLNPQVVDGEIYLPGKKGKKEKGDSPPKESGSPSNGSFALPGSGSAVFDNILKEIQGLKIQLGQTDSGKKAVETTPETTPFKQGFPLKATENLASLASSIKNHSLHALKGTGDETKDKGVKLGLFRQAVVMERNMENLMVYQNLGMGLKPVNGNVPELVERWVFEEFKNYLTMGGFLKGPGNPPRIGLVKDFSEGIPAVVFDINSLKLILREITLNSILAIPAEGQFKVTLRFQNGQVQIQFLDNGVGIKSNRLPNLFTPFQASNQGTGLGLHLCKEIIEKIYGGKITVQSQEGKATLVTLSFPRDGRPLLQFMKNKPVNETQ